EDRADQHGDDGDAPHQRPPVPLQRAEPDVEDAQQRAERRDLRRRRHERGDGRRRALVHVRRPGVERYGADLEQQPPADQRGSDSTSSATNIVSRSCAAGKSSMPPIANIVSGKTSVCANPEDTATRSAGLPGSAEACAVNASPPPGSPSSDRSAMSSTARTDS